MLSNLDKGNIGEELAVNYLLKKGYQILERNYRYSRSEVDIIASIDSLCVFVEVKYREGDRYGHPEKAVTERKLELIAEAAEQYWHENDHFKCIRYDVISITVDKNSGLKEIYHIEDVYF